MFKKMKKLAVALALTIVAAQLVTVMPVHANENGTTGFKCIHEGCNGITEEENRECSECDKAGYYGEFIYQGDNKHLIKDYCWHCKSYAGEKSWDREEACSYRNGVCQYCRNSDYVGTCSHKNCNNEAPKGDNGEQWECDDCCKGIELTYESVTPYSHRTIQKCNSCGEDLGYYITNCSDKNNPYVSEEGYCECGNKIVTEVELCIHKNCNNRVAEGQMLCETCLSITPEKGTRYYIDSKTHRVEYVAKCCNSVVTSEIEEHYDAYCPCLDSLNNNTETEEEKVDSAVQEEKIEASATPESPEEIAERVYTATVVAMEQRVAYEEKLPVEAFTSEEAISALPAEAKEIAGEGATYNLSQVTTTKGFAAAINKIASNNQEKTEKSATVYTNNPITFDTTSLEVFKDTTLTYVFKYQSHLYSVTIPAGSTVDMGGQKFAGPLYIGAKLGTSKLIK